MADHEHGHAEKAEQEHEHQHDGCCGHAKKEEDGGDHSHTEHGHAEHGHAEAEPTGDDICGDGGVLKTVNKAGDSSSGTPPPGSKVKVHYVGTLMDGSKFDSSRDRSGFFEFKIGQGQVIKGWDEGVATMHKGELATLICRHDYAYGESGSPPKIPGKATLKFEVELFSWKEERKQKWELSDEQKVETASAYKTKGTAAFNAGSFDEAQEWYHDAADLLDTADFSNGYPAGREDEAKNLLLSCQLNEAQMCIKQEDWAMTTSVCSTVLQREPDNFKALFRRGLALSKSGEYADAKKDLLAASKIDPKSKEVRNAFAACKEAAEAAKAKEKALASKMFK